MFTLLAMIKILVKPKPKQLNMNKSQLTSVYNMDYTNPESYSDGIPK